MGTNLQRAYGVGGPLIPVMPPPILAERAPATTDTNYPIGQMWVDQSVSPRVIYFHDGGGIWEAGGNAMATTTDPGIVELDDNLADGATANTVPTSVATKTYVDSIAIAGSPVATETTAGIGQLATDAEAVAGTPSTGVLALFVTPSNLTPVFAAPPAIGGTTPAAGAFTNISATGVGTGNILTSDTASSFSTTGAGIDVTIDSASGRVIINGEEAAANAITLLSAAGGIDADAALQINIATSQNAADAIVINASAGGIDITAAGAATEDIDITNTAGSIRLVAGESAADSIVLSSTNGGIDILANGAAAGEDIDISTSASVNITSTENNAGAILITENGGASGRITLNAAQGTGADSINLSSTAGGITLAAALATADAINLAASAGGVDIDGALQVNIASSQNAVDAIRIVASAGGIDIDAVGAATEDINITNTGGSVVIVATESAADSIVIQSTTGGIDILASGAAAGEDIDIIATGSSVNISATEDNSGAITIGTNGGTSERITVTCAQGTNAASIGLVSTAGGITLTAGLATADAININTSDAAGGIDIDAGTAGFIVDTTGGISLDAAAASNFTATGAFDLTIQSTAGSVIVSASEDAADAVQIVSTAGGIDMTAAGAAGEDIDIVCTAGSINLTAGENIATSMVITNTGMDIAITGAAGQDFDLVNTGGSVNITATENVSDAIVINASGAASGMTLDCGTASLTIGTGIKHAVTSVATVDTPYAVLGTDYFITTDTTGGAMTVTLPAVPGTGRTVVVYDGAGQAATGGNVTIDGNGNNIAAAGTSAATKVINTAYESYILTFNGTIWCGQNIV